MRLKYIYSLISVKMDSLPGNTKNRESTRSWLIRVRFLHAWADGLSTRYLICPVICGRAAGAQSLSFERIHTDGSNGPGLTTTPFWRRVLATTPCALFHTTWRERERERERQGALWRCGGGGGAPAPLCRSVQSLLPSLLGLVASLV